MCRNCVCTVEGAFAPLAVVALCVQRRVEPLLRGSGFMCAMLPAFHVWLLLLATVKACSLSACASGCTPKVQLDE